MRIGIAEQLRALTASIMLGVVFGALYDLVSFVGKKTRRFLLAVGVIAAFIILRGLTLFFALNEQLSFLFGIMAGICFHMAAVRPAAAHAIEYISRFLARFFKNS